ncbi:MAG: thiamine pyrophosphate-binding protein [Deltaproteobacteria bacterium]|nr:thiamine pyrophosphate-binding protein [Deltaproteobacteria bacterium]
MPKIKGAEALIEVLKSEGVEYVFGIPGATEVLFMDALEKTTGIKYILGLNELVSAGMAEGYARVTGKPGFLNLHTGPGVAGALAMLYNAQAGGVPLVITAGQQDTRLLQQDPHLTGDIVGMGKIFTKWCTEIHHAEEIPMIMQRAFKMALQHPKGPVLVSLPQNIMNQEIDFKGVKKSSIYSETGADSRAIEQAVDLIKTASHPVIMVESGVTRCNALDEVVRFAELTGSMVYQAWMSDVNFPVRHPLYMGDLDPSMPNTRETLKDADLLIGIGCSIFSPSFYNPEDILPQNIRVMHIDENPWELGKNMATDCGMQGDIKAVLTELNSALENCLPEEIIRKIEKRKQEIEKQKSEKTNILKKQVEAEQNNTPIAVSRLMKEIDNLTGENTVIVDDCWSSSQMLRQVVDLKNAGQFIRARKGGSIGWGLPGAMGAALGAPDKKIIAVCGDGSAAWGMQSLWTAARYNIPVTFVITNNGVYRQVKLVRRHVLGDYVLTEKHAGMDIDEPVINFKGLAEAMGVKGAQVKEPDDLEKALKDAVKNNHPRLIEVFIENKA